MVARKKEIDHCFLISGPEMPLILAKEQFKKNGGGIITGAIHSLRNFLFNGR